jgi:uncharacterized membrane protein YccC
MWPKHEADHSPACKVKVKKVLSFTATSPYAFMALCLSIGTALRLTLQYVAVIATLKAIIKLLPENIMFDLGIQINNEGRKM